MTSAFPAKAVGAYWLSFILFGTALVISGGISFVLYIRHTDAPEREA